MPVQVKSLAVVRICIQQGHYCWKCSNTNNWPRGGNADTCDLQVCSTRQIGFYKDCAGKAERERRQPSRPFSYELLLFAVLMVAIRKHQETHLCLQQHKCVSNHYRKLVGFMDSR